MTEYIFIHLNTYSISNLYGQIDLGKFYLDISDIHQHHPNKTVLLFHIFENLKFSENLSFGLEAFRNILERFNVKYYFVLDGLYENEHDLVNSNNILYLNWGMLYVYCNVFIKKHPVVKEYNPVTGKGLFLCGKGTKPHRIGLLKKLYETDTIHNLSWSFINTNAEKKEIREKFFSEYTDEEFQQFINHCERVLDYNPNYQPKEHAMTFAHYGYPCDIGIYEQTGFSIISETWIHFNHYLFTEKTWRAIANKHPFIMVGQIKNIPKLRELGLRTFNEYLTIPDYNQIENDLDGTLDAVVTNLSNFRTLLEKKEPHIMEKLKQDTEYNFDRFTQLSRMGINKFLSSLQEDESFLESILEFHIEFQGYQRHNGNNG